SSWTLANSSSSGESRRASSSGVKYFMGCISWPFVEGCPFHKRSVLSEHPTSAGSGEANSDPPSCGVRGVLESRHLPRSVAQLVRWPSHHCRTRLYPAPPSVEQPRWPDRSPRL